MADGSKYRTELEARQAYALECLKWCGIKEGSKDHAELIAYYNLIDPLPRSYRMTVKDAWCAAFLSAVAWKLGYRNWYLECSCSRLKEQAKADGTWQEQGYVPQVGDWIVYDLDGNKAVDHIGVVVGVEGNRVFVCEGNYSDSVKNRLDLELDDERIVGYIVNDFTELVAKTTTSEPIRVSGTKEAQLFDTIEEVPEAYRPTIAVLIADGVLRGYGSADKLGLSEELCRALVIQERRHQVFLERLAAAGVLEIE